MQTLGKVAKELTINPHTIRYYIKIGLIKPKRDLGNNYQLLSGYEIKKLQFIVNAKSIGFTLTEIKQIFEDADSGQSACPRVRKILERHIEASEEKIKTLVELNKKMKRVYSGWQELDDRAPDGNSVCHLIEKISTLLDNAD